MCFCAFRCRLTSSLLKTHPAFRASIPRSFYLNCVSGFARRRGAGADPDDDAFYLAGGAFGDADRRAMFVGLMVGGVLADRYERKK